MPADKADLGEAARRYEETLARAFGTQPPETERPLRVPIFDLLFLGIGDDGTPASLFSGGKNSLTSTIVGSSWLPPDPDARRALP